MNHLPTRILFALACVLALDATASAQRSLTVPAFRIATPPVIDGTVDDHGEWKGVPSFSGLVDTNTGKPVSEGGKFWLGYDERYIYFAARLRDSQPNRIEATEYHTNVDLSGNDTVTLEVDPFGQHNDENYFTMNAAGGTTVQIAGGRAAKREWVGAFVAKGRITPEGWEVEARIPWRIMRLPRAGEHRVLFNVERNHRRLQKEEAWQDTIGAGNIQNFGRWEAPEIPKTGEKTIKLLPYSYAGYSHDSGAISNSGVDFRTPITDTLDFVGSANPDFRNIENNILSLDASHFARIASESRPFFLEGQQYFNTSLDAPLFASQMIRRFDLGFKTVGKLDRATNLGVLDAISYGSENDLAANVTRQLSAHSFAQAAVTNMEQDGLRNTGTFLQARQDFGPYSFYAQHETTDDTLNGFGHRYNIGYFSQINGLNNSGEYTEISPDFLPRLGFAPQTDYHGFDQYLEYLRPQKAGPFLNTDIGFNWHTFSTFEGQVYRRGYEFSGGVDLRRTGWSILLDHQYDRFQGLDDDVNTVELVRPRNNPYRFLDLTFSRGKFGGQYLEEDVANVGYRPLKKLQLTASLRRLRLDSDEQHQEIVSANWDLGNDRAINGRLVQQGHDVNWYVAYKRSGNTGAEYYLILGDPNAPTFRTSLILKVAWPFEFKR